jgi:pyridoxal phosphate enzyme (YggS family)
MSVNLEAYNDITQQLSAGKVCLVAVSKLKPESDILALYQAGQRDFGENYVQELVQKQPLLPQDIRWHFIGHLQSNKIKFIAPFVNLIHGVESWKLLHAINKEGAKINRKIKCLLQVHVAVEETKFGLSHEELFDLLDQYTDWQEGSFVEICGIMGMASFTENQEQLKKEFHQLREIFDTAKEKYFYHDDAFQILSMGMSGDYELAIREGSTMVRIGSLIFGARN